MNKILMILALLFYVSSCFADDNLKSNVQRFIRAYASGDLDKASEELFCPKDFGKDKIFKKRDKLVEELKVLRKPFGKIVSVSPIVDKSYTVLMLACSTKSDYESFKIVGADVFLVTHENGMKSILKLYYVSGPTNPVLGMVGIGEAGFGYDALKRQYEKHKQLSK